MLATRTRPCSHCVEKGLGTRANSIRQAQPQVWELALGLSFRYATSIASCSTCGRAHGRSAPSITKSTGAPSSASK